MITLEYLKSILDYNPDTGIFIWKVNGNNQFVKIGGVAGHMRKNGYIVIRINKKNYRGHRLAWMYIYGEFPSEQIDHINHNRADNRISNLRLASNQENQRNASKRKDNTSGICGISWAKRQNKWRADIKVNQKQINLGYFADINQAIEARKNANIKYLFHENHGNAA